MKKNRAIRVLSAAALAIITAPVLAACTAGSAAEGGEDVLDTVLKNGVVRVGECMGNPPYASYDSANKPEGYDIDIANLIGDALGVSVEIVDTSSANRIPSLQTDQVDVVLCNTTRTLERVTQVAFTDTYAIAGSTILAKADAGIAGVEDLNGRKVAVPKGTPFGEVLAELAPEAEVISFDLISDAVAAVKQGQADALVEDSNALLYQASFDDSLIVTTESLTPLYYNSFAVKYGSPKWLAWLNEFLFDLNVTGKNAALYEKWFGAEPTFVLNPQY